MRLTRYLTMAFALALPSHAFAQDAPSKPPETQPPDAKKQAEAKGNLMPVIAGIESAQTSAKALQELAGTEPFERRDARKTAQIAEQGAKVAHERAEDLAKMKGLPPEAREEAKAAAKKLKEARSTIKHIQREVGTIEGHFHRDQAKSVADLSAKLTTELEDARRSIQKVADTYGVSMDLQERAPAHAPGPG
jgi:hypothetical protein